MTNDKQARKETPIYNGFLMYFPDACAAVAACSFIANEQHNPGTPMHWDRAKSGDELDALMRHLMEAGEMDDDGILHSTKVAWRALANLQKEIEVQKLVDKADAVWEGEGRSKNCVCRCEPCICVG